MEFNWDEFRGKYANEQEARSGFAILCGLLMENKYPDFIIKNSDNIDENNKKKDDTLDKKCKVFLPKYFLDGVSNSRKGQIRKSLNDNLPYMKANKITEWYLLMPLEFSPEEQNWWENWSLRIKQENGVTPIAILSSKLVEMIADLDQDFKGTETIERRKKVAAIEIAEPEAKSSDTVDFIAEESGFVVDDGPQPAIENSPAEGSVVVENNLDKTIAIIAKAVQASENQSQGDEEPKAESTTVETTADSVEINTGAVEGTQEFDMAAKPKLAKSAKMASIPEPTLNQLDKTWDFKQKFEALESEKLALPTDKENNQRAVFDKRRDESTVKNYLNDFVFGDMSKFTGKELIKKAKIYVTNQQYSRGLYIYEYAKTKDLLTDADLLSDFDKGVKEASYKLNYKYNMINGDLLFAKRDYINASETYEKAMGILNDYEQYLNDIVETEGMNAVDFSSLIRDDEAEVKYLESKAESLLQIGDFTQAKTNFELALSLEPGNANIKKRLELAEYLQKGTHFFKKPFQWLNIFVAPFYYFKARKIDPNIKELKNAEKLRNQAIWGLVVILLILGALAMLFFVGKKVVEAPVDPQVAQPEVMSATTPREIYLQKGDYYMNRISAENPHYIDSAIYAYDRARRFECTDTLAESGYNKAMIARNNYLEQVQLNISTDSATYFLSMRRPTEGLRLFKYKYEPTDPEKGKFGYVDENGVVKIAPMYDFNYKKMDGNGETFYNGKAKVCLKVADYDTVYFYIDQLGNKIEGLDENGNQISR
ncbi:MAG: hypothetical protein MJZ61_07185 [Bacteroidales bacterium]|nr:hypothetical protein [Bacteroidales bacterium]